MAITRINRTELDILRDVRASLLQNVGISADNDTSTVLTLAKSMSSELASVWDLANGLLTKGFLSSSYGDGLDSFGVLLQESRSTSKRAMDLSSSNLKFYLDVSYAIDITDLINRYFTTTDRATLFNLNLIDSTVNPSTLLLPAGITVYSQDGSAAYTVMNPITISNNNLSSYSPLVAISNGTSYNVAPGVLTSHNISTMNPILAKISKAIKVTNAYGIRNGGDLESDANYRFRLSNKAVSAVSSNDSSILKAVLSVPGVVNAGIIPRTHGNGTFTIFPKSKDPILSDGVINAVKASVSNTIASGSLVFVEAPLYLAVSMNIELRFDIGADINSIFSGARLTVMDYINNLDLGGEIVINEIIQRVMSIDNKIIDMNIPQFGYGMYNRQTGNITNYTTLRLLNQSADWNQKWFTNSSLISICEIGTR